MNMFLRRLKVTILKITVHFLLKRKSFEEALSDFNDN